MRRIEEATSQKISQHCQTSLAHLCDHFCLQRGPQRPVRHTQDNDNKPTIKAFKIQLEPGLELTPSNTFPAVLTHLGWGWPLEPGKGFFSFQQPSDYFHCNTRAKDTRHSNFYPVTRSPSQESDICLHYVGLSAARAN